MYKVQCDVTKYKVTCYLFQLFTVIKSGKKLIVKLLTLRRILSILLSNSGQNEELLNGILSSKGDRLSQNCANAVYLVSCPLIGMQGKTFMPCSLYILYALFITYFWDISALQHDSVHQVHCCAAVMIK